MPQPSWSHPYKYSWYLKLIIWISSSFGLGQGRQGGWWLSTSKDHPSPEVSSTRLYLHRRLYRRQPPHDRTLYETLHVSPTATAAQIETAYQTLCHKYQSTTTTTNNNDDVNHPTDTTAALLLDEIHAAYDILKTDETRWPYHLYGLRGHEIHTLPLVRLFLGQPSIFPSPDDDACETPTQMDPALQELLQWMGHEYGTATDAVLSSTATATKVVPHNNTKAVRIHRLATDLVEGWLRPYVEGRLTKSALVQRVTSMSDRRKTALPMGAQVLRCIGRAYQHAGKAYIRQHQFLDHGGGGVLWNTAREHVRQGQYWWTAAGWRSRAIWAQRVATWRSKKASPSSETPNSITYFNEDDDREEEEDDVATVSTEEDEVSTPAQSHEEMRALERWNAQSTLRQVTLIEALWKTYKIDLYRTVRQACDSIFSGEYFFYPRSLSTCGGGTTIIPQVDGWVGSKDQTIDTEKGLQRVAEGLVLMGTVMVERSKQGTAWRK